MTLATQFAAYAAWRSQLGLGLERLRDWLAENELGDAQADMRLTQLGERLREDRLNVAFVAEFSRGKSELINAIFFADYGNRMLPSSAGRTTMCPTELMFDPAKPPSVELLPIETRTRNTSISEYKRMPAEWRIEPLDINSAEAMQETLRHVSEVIRVERGVAEDLGFAVGDDSIDTFHVGDDGRVEIPRWRHAIINFPHPLLKQGLVILDTPGLNAIGTEPELTLSLLPNAHAVLFILAADTGVTQSDLAIWREHVSAPDGRKKGRLVVLNKIDGQWDELKTEEEIEAEIERQCRTCASILDLPAHQIFPVSAQKGLVAKINDDAALLERSRLSQLEAALSEELIPAKQEIVREGTDADFAELYMRTRGLLESRLAGLREQLSELGELRGRNKGVVEYMMGKVRAEKEEFEAGLQRFYAVRSVFSTHTNKLLEHLGLDGLRARTQATREWMLGATLSLQLSEAMSSFFRSTRDSLAQSTTEINEIHAMMEAIYRKFSVEHGLKLGSPPEFSLRRHEKEIVRLETWCNTHLNTMAQLLRHGKKNLTQKFFEEVALQVRRAFEHANRHAEGWLKAVMAPMETQVREHQIQLKRRLESIKRIHQATDSLEDKISELTHLEASLVAQIQSLETVASTIRLALEAPIDSSDQMVVTL